MDERGNEQANREAQQVGRELFTLPVLQAINNWQRGGDAKQMLRRGMALKEACASLSNEFRECHLMCFRQIALLKGAVWDIVVEGALAEKISAWTIDSAVAKSFKGGVPPDGQGYWGVIFTYMPKRENVVVNLKSVYADPRFLRACEALRRDIDGYADGIGRYADEQSEVVLEVEGLGRDDLYSFGGHSSPFDQLVERTAHYIYGRPPSPEELQALFLKVEHVRGCAGPAWLSQEATRRVLDRLAPHAELLAAVKAIQSSMHLKL